MKSAAGIAAGLGLTSAFPCPGFARTMDINEKLNLAHIGLGGMQGSFHRSSCASENRVAICDVDKENLERYGADMPDAKKYVDFRDMYADMGDKIDAVVITTTDHTHAIAAIEGMKLGIAPYVEKPLAHDVYQIRTMLKYAKEKNLTTQMGTQIHAGDNYRRVVELVRAGAIGKISRIDVWVGTVWGGKQDKSGEYEIPATLDWDRWLGPAHERPYHPVYFKGNWRSFWEFGNGGMGDMGCHFMDLPFWALDLQYPKTIEAFCDEPADEDYAAKDLRVEYVFPGVKGTTDELAVSWSDGKIKPESLEKYGVTEGNGVLFIGEEGALYSNYSSHRLIFNDKNKTFATPPQSIPASVGHHREWINAIKNGTTDTTCNFDYSGRVAETVLLGPVAYRCGQKIVYDAKNMAVTNCDKAAKFLKQEVREGWEV